MSPSVDECRALLEVLIAYCDLSEVPEETLVELRDMGMIKYDESHMTHISSLMVIAEDLRQPTHPQRFFDRYSSVMPNIVAHSLLTTELAAKAVMWRNGVSDTNAMKDAVDEYQRKFRELTDTHS